MATSLVQRARIVAASGLQQLQGLLTNVVRGATRAVGTLTAPNFRSLYRLSRYRGAGAALETTSY